MSLSRRLSRRYAVQGLYCLALRQDLSAAEQLRRQILALHGHSQTEETPFFDQLLGGCLAHIERLDEAIQQQQDAILLDPLEQAILRVSLYELWFCQDTPLKVVLDEAIEIVKLYGSENSYRFVNAVLDRLAKKVQHQECG